MAVIDVTPFLNGSVQNGLNSKGEFDNVRDEKKGLESQNSSLRNRSTDSCVESDRLDRLAVPSLADTPNSYKKRGVALSRNFVQLCRSAKTFDLLKNDPKAFLLLTWICLKAHREFDPITELEEGECFLSEDDCPGGCGLSNKEFRCAKMRLLKDGHITIAFSPAWLRSKNPTEYLELEKFKKRAMKRAVKCTIVKLCKLDVYDINLKSKGGEKGGERAVKGRQTIRLQEEEVKNKTDPLPPKGGVEVSFSNSSKEDKKTHVHRDVFLSDQDLKECIEVRGSLDIIKTVIDQILDWPDRKYAIRRWKHQILTWDLKNHQKDTSEENERYGRALEKQFEHIKQGWTLRHYRDKIKDDIGLLFECLGSYRSDSFLISYSKKDFKQKVADVIREKNMKPREVKT